MSGGNKNYELYRKSTLGVCLAEALDELVKQNTLPPELSYRILLQFDRSINEALATHVKTKVNFRV